MGSVLRSAFGVGLKVMDLWGPFTVHGLIFLKLTIFANSAGVILKGELPPECSAEVLRSLFKNISPVILFFLHISS